jgi:hypothetical protein
MPSILVDKPGDRRRLRLPGQRIASNRVADPSQRRVLAATSEPSGDQQSAGDKTGGHLESPSQNSLVCYFSAAAQFWVSNRDKIGLAVEFRSNSSSSIVSVLEAAAYPERSVFPFPGLRGC